MGATMNRLLVTTAALLPLAATGSAAAADLPVAPVYKALVAVAQVDNWTGFYLGGNIGYSWGRSATTVPLSDPVAGILSSSSPRFDLNGVIGGGPGLRPERRHHDVVARRLQLQIRFQRSDPRKVPIAPVTNSQGRYGAADKVLFSALNRSAG
jgi:opacity protein-like surface antigen